MSRRRRDTPEDTADKAMGSARELARAREPSQMLVYKKDGTVQTERTYG